MDTERWKYKWVILATALQSDGLTFGLVFAVGVLYKDWIRYFDSSASFLSLVGSSPSAVSSIFGPVFGYLLDKLNYRKCGIIGGILMAIGMVASSQVDNALQLLFTFGFLTGFGLGLNFFSATTIINEYFVENRMFAEGFLSGGSSLGIFLFFWFQQYLSNHYSWRGAMLICGGFSLNLCVGAMFLIPAKSIPMHSLNFWRYKDNDNHKGKSVTGTIKTISHSEMKAFKEPDSNGELTNTEKQLSFWQRSIILWKNPLFLMILIAETFTWFGVMIPYVQLVERGRSEGLDENTASWLSSTIGIVGIVAKPATGYLAGRLKFHPLWVFAGNQCICGVATFISSFWSSKAGLFTYAVAFGLFSNDYAYCKSATAKLLERRCFADAFSWILLFEGFGVIAGPFLAGYVRDTTQSYDWSFRLSGILLVAAAAVCLFKPIGQRYCRQKNEKTQQNHQSLNQTKLDTVLANPNST